MSLRNLVPLATTTHSGTTSLTQGTSLTETNSEASTYDSSDSTYWQSYLYHNGDGTCSGNLISEHTWSSAQTISKLRTKTYWDAVMGNYASWSYSIDISLKIGGSWTSVYSTDASGSSSDPTAVTNDTTLTTGWTNVTGIRATLTGSAYSYEGTRTQNIYLRVYEVEAFVNVNSSYAGYI